MAGHRKGTGRPRRSDSRAASHKARLMNAPTAEAQLAAAFDWYRSAAHRHSTPEEMAKVAAVLANTAAELERSAA